MASLQDLTIAIDRLLQHTLGTNNYRLVRVVEEKAYEAYLFALCLRAVRELGVTPILKGVKGAPAPFVFRGAPGKIYSTLRNYGYAEFRLGEYEYEIHAGIEIRGTSGMTHELDVAILRSHDAVDCRRGRNDPPGASLVAGWECKFYTGTLSKSLGRQFVGLVKDLGTNLRLNGLCSNVGNPQLKLYFQGKDRPYAHFPLTPLETSNENVFVNQLKGELKKLTGT